MTVAHRPLCPVDPSHGAVQDWPTSRWGFYCPHTAHDGRPKSHPLGEAPATRAFYTTSEVEAGFIHTAGDPDAVPSRPSVGTA